MTEIQDKYGLGLFCHFLLSSGVNSNNGNHATHFKSCADYIKSFCHRHRALTLIT